MTDTTLLTDLFKNAPTASSLSGLLMLFANASGELQKMNKRPLLNYGSLKQMDQVLPTGFYQIGYPLTGTFPEGFSSGAATFSLLFSWTPADTTDYSIQILFRATSTNVWIRNYVKGTFSSWKTII